MTHCLLYPEELLFCGSSHKCSNFKLCHIQNEILFHIRKAKKLEEA